jgi:hypothetical protein
VKCCGESFGAALTWDEADDIGFAWWVCQDHEHASRDWTYEIVRRQEACGKQ